ncbi:TatD DNase family protein [Lachnotalea glycerini]|uniref:TatD DNase family protein n=1 Tax=Lachnotalea glycerini TaxID=1763509 RepID=A0A318EQW2_9FIRM|nr:TatD family hydrolase [Lachnotalea glycerini]OYP56252.1 hydrolase TatD [Lachnotalea glycerini]PXV84911.1 TatD DNase family protein [Lachnotalea glycerini]
MIFESHAHYDDEAFNDDRDELLNSMTEHGIEYVVNVGASLASTATTVQLVKKYSFMYGAIGVHPNETKELNENNYEWLKQQCKQDKIVAIGEIGLDYYWDEPDKEIQIKWFKRQLELAKEARLPIIIHSRDAAKDTLSIMKEEKAQELNGVIHCFSYSKDMAREYLNMGYYLGIGGVVTFSNAKKLKEVVEYVPVENMLLETDSPYLSPVPNRGKRNSSLNIPYIAKAIAAIKNIDYDEIINITNNNARKLFNIR